MKIYIFQCITNTDREFQVSCVDPMSRYDYLLEGEEMKDYILTSVVVRADVKI